MTAGAYIYIAAWSGENILKVDIVTGIEKVSKTVIGNLDRLQLKEKHMKLAVREAGEKAFTSGAGERVGGIIFSKKKGCFINETSKCPLVVSTGIILRFSYEFSDFIFLI